MAKNDGPDNGDLGVSFNQTQPSNDLAVDVRSQLGDVVGIRSQPIETCKYWWKVPVDLQVFGLVQYQCNEPNRRAGVVRTFQIVPKSVIVIFSEQCFDVSGVEVADKLLKRMQATFSMTKASVGNANQTINIRAALEYIREYSSPTWSGIVGR